MVHLQKFLKRNFTWVLSKDCEGLWKLCSDISTHISVFVFLIFQKKNLSKFILKVYGIINNLTLGQKCIQIKNNL